MSRWPKVPIGSVCLGIWDGPHATPKPAHEGPVYLGIKNITEDGMLDLSDVRHIHEDDFALWTKRATPTHGDIVFTYEATLNRYALIPEGFRGCLGRRTALIRTNRELVDGTYLFYQFFGSEWRETIGNNILSGSTVDRIPIARFPSFEIRLPALAVQHKIASILSAYDDLIENNLRRIKILEEMAQSLYREWFVDFRFPGHENFKMVDSLLGMIPEGWEISRVDDFAVVMRGRSYSSENLVEAGGLPFVNLKCIDRDGGFRRSGLKRYAGPFKSHQGVSCGDVVMAVTDMTQERRIVARAARVPDVGEAGGVISMDLVRLEPRANVTDAYLYGFLRFSAFPDEVKNHASGVNVLHLNPERISDYETPMPPTHLVESFSILADDIFLQQEVLETQSECLRSSRDLLLPKLISGEPDVSDLDIDMAETAA